MKIKPTFFNTRTERLHWDYIDTNNRMFTILFDSGAELTFILRDLKKDNSIVNYILENYTEIANEAENETDFYMDTMEKWKNKIYPFDK